MMAYGEHEAVSLVYTDQKGTETKTKWTNKKKQVFSLISILRRNSYSLILQLGLSK